jgi:hypothetical protein
MILGVNLGYHSKKLYPLINDQYTVRPDEAFRFAVGSFIENVWGYGFLFRSEICFRTTRELEYYFFLSCIARIFFPEFNIRLYDKNSESDFVFPVESYVFNE